MMNRKIRVATTSFATLEDVKPPYNLRHPSTSENLTLGLSLLDAAGKTGVDLVCLPETFIAAGLPYQGEVIRSVAEPIPGPTFDAVAELARKYSMNVVAGLHQNDNGVIKNVAMVIDRSGKLNGLYAKQHPTEGEIGCGITPGSETRVFETDLGKIGLGICFDLNWQSMWAEMAVQGADLVCWISAYPGGFPLQAYAYLYQYPIISSIWPYNASIIDITGRILATTTRWSRLAFYDLNLDKRLFHTDNQMHQLLPIQTAYGRRIKIETFNDEHLFTLESCDPDLIIEEVIHKFQLTDYKTYIDQCTAAQDNARSR
jgi:beta-ureidopropionase